ncbi:MAG: HDOD domain-containing protein [Rhodocyclaceae bacterium]
MQQGVLITREPVVNKQRAITANRLIVHATNVAEAAVALNSLSEVWPSEHMVFLSLGKLVPTPELLTWQVPPNTMVEIPAQTLQHPHTQALLSQLNAAGVPLGLAWYQPGVQWPDGVDCRFSLADARRVPSPTGAPGLVLAWGLGDLTSFAPAVSAGYAGAVGMFFLRGTNAATKLEASHAQIVRLLNLVRQNADIADIEAALKQDVTLSYKLLRYINSAGFGLMVEVQSFRHAVTILGMDKLNKWLSLLLVSASRDPGAPAVMQAAIARGRLMELLGAQMFDRSELDNLFITGAFSLLDVLLNTSLDAILEHMALPASITDALLHNEGSYAPLLNLARATETFLPDALRHQCEALGIPPADVASALVRAVGFADGLNFG